MSYRILRAAVLAVAAFLPLQVVDVAADSASVPTITAITAGQYHTCALTSGGGVECWGSNGTGQLGDGSTIDSSNPVEVLGLAGGLTAIAAGWEHSCALTDGGGVTCWGYNANGQLGDGSTTNSSTPVDVSGLASGVTAIAAGYYHTCAAMEVGGVKCWGYNGAGQLGDGSTTDSSTPVDVSGLTGKVTAIAAGQYHTCALMSGGAVKCWGPNGSGQLGNGSTTDSRVPVDVSGLATGVSAISAAGGNHTCAVMSGGAVKCWGQNDAGKLGDGTTTMSRVPIDVSGVTSGVIAIAAGPFHSCAVTGGGGVKCWGYNNHGQLGNGTTTQSSIAVDVSDLTSGITAIAVGYYHSCALTGGGAVRCWGDNVAGQLGNGTTIESGILVPVDVAGLTSRVTAIAAGIAHTCALTSGGGVMCWGSNDSGQLGDGTTTQRSVPVDVVGLTSGVTAIAAGYNHTCALMHLGGVKCWGSNGYGTGGLGTRVPTDSSIPVDVSGLDRMVRAVAAGDSHTCALTNGGGVKCWGYNRGGTLGNGTTTDSLVPVDVSGLASRVRAISVGPYETCALMSGGGVKCWGYNDNGQLGDGTTTDSSTPVDVAGLASKVTAISAGGFHICVLTTGGGVKCWGQNKFGQLGNGTTDSNAPLGVSGLASGVTAIAAGQYHTCIVTNAGGVKCWGQGYFGQLGNSEASLNRIPVDVSGLASGVTAVATGYSHTCAITSGGGVKCWGDNTFGQLGNGTRTAGSLVPVDVDFAGQGPPSTDAADPGSDERPADYPLLPVLAGLGGGIALLARRRVVPAPHPVEGRQTDPGS